MSLERLDFGDVREAYPDRFKKLDLAAGSIAPVDPERGQYAVRRADSETAHPVRYVVALGHTWGECECKGFKHHEGPCSHLCGVHRAELAEIISPPELPVREIVPEPPRDPQEEAAQNHVEKARADGGRRGGL